MSDQDELPQWSAAAGQSAAHYVQPPKPSRGRGILFGLGALAALVGMAALGYFIAQSRSDSTETSTEPAAPTVDQDETPSDDGSGGATDGMEADDTSEDQDSSMEGEDDTITVDVNETEGGGDDESTAAPDTDMVQSERTAVLKEGKVYLQGSVPSQEIIDAIVAKAAAVIGPDNVVVEYEIDPTTPFDPGESTPLYVEDVVLFPFNSAEIDPRFYPLLDLGVLLLSQNPQATVTVVTRTDAVGSEQVNLEMATERAEAVIDYWAGKGVDRDQVIADPRGEEDAVEDAGEEQAARERRAEFIITGLLQ